MKQVTLRVPDKKYPFIMELIREFGFIKVVQSITEDNEPTKDILSKKKSIELKHAIDEGRKSGYIDASIVISKLKSKMEK